VKGLGINQSSSWRRCSKPIYFTRKFICSKVLMALITFDRYGTLYLLYAFPSISVCMSTSSAKTVALWLKKPKRNEKENHCYHKY
jgi:hypothetical protein